MRKPKQISSQDISRMSALSKTVRRDTIDMIYGAGSGNPGSTLSAVEILVWLYDHELHIKAEDPHWNDRDRVILSKGQAAPAYYSLFCHLGQVSRNELSGFRGFDTRLATHPEYGSIPSIDFTSGSLGMGLSAANGMALAARLKNLPDPRYFVIMGDGELQEGQVWEAAMTGGHYNLHEVTLIIDRNVFQGDRSTKDVMHLEPLAEKWQSFGWDVAEADGHDYNSLSKAFSSLSQNKPKVLIAHTTKGKGVSFMEGDNLWHTGGKKFTKPFYDQALKDLEDLK